MHLVGWSARRASNAECVMCEPIELGDTYIIQNKPFCIAEDEVLASETADAILANRYFKLHNLKNVAQKVIDVTVRRQGGF